ncbi:glycosyltransferase family 2 protein [Caldibacillus sp. 210928-DFI.2.22]|uniref:glycosyltransferase family 2 protein n=1 Tax=unclassified Caldibacillus TaxID=2641266 RepID=UPI001D081561|nr:MULTISPECIES: glycosyltransferase family 2 protein [unclassified Caldibacillus]MCB7070332.1 glycosyltransferase family 2 protein [Caldibacillus sp. 210928-DFI.2.22]MCB7073864.1 glycosyltransferase family 2 protein [Caldibacillus sp. 210928-DFI.2.18]
MLSIVVVNWNGEVFLENFFTSLENQTYKEFIVYFVDNGSQDNSIKITEKFTRNLNIDIIRLDKNTGFSVANNIGIKKALKDNSNFIITLNNDMELDKSCLYKLNEAIQKFPEYDVFQILMMDYNNRDIIDAAGIEFNKHYYASQIGLGKSLHFLEKLSTDIPGVCAGAAAYSKRALSTIKDHNGNFFDPIYFAYYEDVDLVLRLLKNNFKSKLVKDSIVYHIHSGTGGKESDFKTYYLARNLLIYTKKNLPNTTYKKCLPVYLFRFFIQGFKHLIKGNIKRCKALLNGIRDGLSYKTQR